jgi:hypothetical protein
MKKNLSIVLAASMICLIASGCSNLKPNDDVAGNSSDAASSANFSSSEVIDNESSNYTSSVAEDNGLEELLGEIYNYQYGSAGSSLKATICAVDLLDWTEDNTLSEDEIKAKANEFLSELGEENQPQFKLHYQIISDLAYEIIIGEEEINPDAGAQPKYETYTKEKYEVFKNALDDVTASITDMENPME